MNIALFPDILMNSPLILLDVDETLVDIDYKLTCPASEWHAALRRAEARGAIIGLNSDSAYDTLQKRAVAHGIKGPVIAERGALIARSPDEKVLCASAEAREFRKFRQVFLRTLTTGANLARYLTVVGHVNEVANRLPKLPTNGCVNGIAVLINGLRQCSMSFFVRKQCRTGWTKDVPALDGVIDIAALIGRKKFPKLWAMRDIDRNPDYGICVYHHRDTQKSMACDPLVKLFGDREIYMVGNSMSDFMDDSRVKHCAVENASPEFKKRCILIADQERTRGAIELIGQITA